MDIGDIVRAPDIEGNTIAIVRGFTSMGRVNIEYANGIEATFVPEKLTVDNSLKVAFSVEKQATQIAKKQYNA